MANNARLSSNLTRKIDNNNDRLSDVNGAHPSLDETPSSNSDRLNGAHPSLENGKMKTSLADVFHEITTLTDAPSTSISSAHPSVEKASFVSEIDDSNCDKFAIENGAHPSSDETQSSNSAHPSLENGDMKTKLVTVFHEIKDPTDGSSIVISGAHPSLEDANLLDENREIISARFSIVNSAHPSPDETQSSNSDELNGAHPSLENVNMKTNLVEVFHEIIDLSDAPSISISSAHPAVNETSLVSEIDDPNSDKFAIVNGAHPSFIREIMAEMPNLADETAGTNQDHLLRAYSNLFHSQITSLVESKAEDPSREDFRAYLQWFSAVYQPGMQLGRNKPPEPASGSQGPSGEDPPADNEAILRELSDIRQLLLQQLLAQSGATEAEALKTLGEWRWSECGVCLERRWLFARPCCSLPVCEDCLKRYLAARVAEGAVKIQCCNPECQVFVPRDEISACLDSQDKARFYHFLARANAEPWVKTCPRCSHLTSFAKVKPSLMKNTHKHPVRSRVVCGECALSWCFACHAPWHPGFTCKQYRKGDRLMKTWANELHHGQLNAQKCPKCQVYIQRSTGCDHMHCTRCECDFCYRCGDRLRKLRFFGDHYSKLSVFGCKFRYKADQPLQRKLVRGAVFGSKLMVAPLLGTLGACAGVIALGFGIFVLPVYGGVRLYQKFSPKLM